jgi:hypothetical protein
MLSIFSFVAGFLGLSSFPLFPDRALVKKFSIALLNNPGPELFDSQYKFTYLVPFLPF